MYFKLCWTSIGWCRCGIPAKVSLNAFHVDVGEKAASAGSSSIRAALAGVGPRNGGSSPETHGFFPQKKWFSCEFSLNQLETHGSLDGFSGEILTGNPGFFTIKLLGGSCRFSHWSNEWMDFWGCSMLWHSKHDLFLITICYWLQVVFARPGVAGVAQRQQSRIHGEAGKYRQGQADS